MGRSRTLALAAALVFSIAAQSSSAFATTPPGCTEQQTTVTTVTQNGASSTTTVATTTYTICPETLTLAPSAAGPTAQVTATLTGAQPQICTVYVRTVRTVIQVPAYENGVQVGYTSQVLTDTSTSTTCTVNTATIEFAGAVVGTATLSSSGLVGTFMVPAASPGAYTVTATPDAGTVASAQFTVLDTIPPFISGFAAPAANAAGWNSGDVFVSFVCADADSGIRTCPDTVTVSTEGKDQSVTGTAVDNAGNTASFTLTGINIDRTSPTIEPHASRSPDHGSWYTAPVTISFDCEDALSGIAFCTAPVTLSTDGRGVLYGADAFDNAGNGLQFANNLNIDQTPPTITAPPAVIAATAATTCAAAPALGSPAAADNLGVVSVTNDAPAAFAKGTTTVTWTAMDPAGHSATSTQLVTVNDLERPVLVAPPAVNAVATSAAGAMIPTTALGSATASDNCPGVDAATVSGIPAGNLFPIGATTLTWTATDASGNTGTATQTITVSYGVCLLYDATKAAQPGSTIPIKLQLCSASGANQSSPASLPRAVDAVLTGSATPVGVSASGNANPGNVFRYDATLGGTGGYIFNLDTTGLASGSWQLRFSLNGQMYTAPFLVK